MAAGLPRRLVARRAAIAAADESLWLEQASVRSGAGRAPRQRREAAAAMGGPEILQRVRPERISQGQRWRACWRACSTTPKPASTVRLFKSHKQGIADGDQRRDFIYVDDAVAVMRWLLDTPTVSGHLQCRHRQGAQLPRHDRRRCSRALGRAPNIEYIDMPEAIRGAISVFHASRRRMACARAGYNAGFTPLEEAVTRYVTQYLDRDGPLSLMFDFDQELSQARGRHGALHRRPDARRLRLWRGRAHLAGSAGAGDRGQAQRHDDRRRRQCRPQHRGPRRASACSSVWSAMTMPAAR